MQFFKCYSLFNFVLYKFCFFVYQVYYRLGLSLVGLKRYIEAMYFFVIVFDFVEIEEEKYDILLQIITVVFEVRGRYLVLGVIFFFILQGFYWVVEIRECFGLYVKFFVLILWVVFLYILYCIFFCYFIFFCSYNIENFVFYMIKLVDVIFLDLYV